MYKEERSVFQGEMREREKYDVEKFDTLDSSEKTIAIPGDGWWPHAAKQGGDKTTVAVVFYLIIWKRRNERPNIGGVSVSSRKGASSRKGCVAKWSNG